MKNKKENFKLEKKNKFAGKKVLISLGALVVGGYIIASSITGCNETETEVMETPTPKVELPTSTPVMDDVKEFEAYTHIVVVHVVRNSNNMFNSNNNELQSDYQKNIEVPYGYELMDVESYVFDNGNSDSYCFDYYYRNITDVIVMGTYDYDSLAYDYSSFGSVVDKSFTPKVK